MIQMIRSRVRAHSLMFASLLALMLSIPSPVVIRAADGDLDPTFGAGGIQKVEPAGDFEEGKAVALQADGKIVVAASTWVADVPMFSLVRLQPNGALDTTFGVSGRVTTPFPGGVPAWPNAIVIQADGRIVVAGSAMMHSNRDFALARYHRDGTLDTSFGINGLVISDFGTDTLEGAAAMVLQSDGKILAAGTILPLSTEWEFVVARYNTDGSLDASFDGDGRMMTSFPSTTHSMASAVGVQPDGKVVVAGWTGSALGDKDFALARDNSDGSLDTTFGTGGLVSTDFGEAGGLTAFTAAKALAIQPDGKIVAAGILDLSIHRDFALVRYEADGTLDATFGTGGMVRTDTGSSEHIWSIGLQADGRIVVAGRSLVGIGTTRVDFAVARYDANGALDATFGTGGVVVTDIDSREDSLFGMVIQPDGKILVVGATGQLAPDGGEINRIALVRYGAPPSHDMVFFPHGTDIAPTAGAFTMNQTAPSSQVVLAGVNGKSWLSDPVLNGAFLPASTFTVQLPCPLGVSLSKKVRLSTTDVSGAGEQVLGEVTTSPRLCSTQAIAVPVTAPAGVSARRLKLTIKSATILPTSIVLGSNTFVRATAFVGVP